MKVQKQILGGLPAEQINPLAPQFGDYDLGPVFHNGAADFIYQKPTLYPLVTLTGPGRPTQTQMNVFQPPQVRVTLAVPAASVAGAGVIAGGITLQQLIDESNTASAQTHNMNTPNG